MSDRHVDAFVAHLLELLESFGAVRARKMFGGYGLYHQDIMFGLVADEVFYLKVDAESKPIFEAEGLQPFTYDGKHKPVVMSYHQVPDEALDDPDVMRHWASIGFAAAKRNKTAK